MEMIQTNIIIRRNLLIQSRPHEIHKNLETLFDTDRRHQFAKYGKDIMTIFSPFKKKKSSHKKILQSVAKIIYRTSNNMLKMSLHKLI